MSQFSDAFFEIWYPQDNIFVFAIFHEEIYRRAFQENAQKPNSAALDGESRYELGLANSVIKIKINI